MTTCAIHVITCEIHVITCKIHVIIVKLQGYNLFAYSNSYLSEEKLPNLTYSQSYKITIHYHSRVTLISERNPSSTGEGSPYDFDGDKK